MTGAGGAVVEPAVARGAALAGSGRGKALALFILAVLLVGQGLAYGFRLRLSFGPRVILEPWLLEQGLVIYESVADIHAPLLPLLLRALRFWCPDAVLLAKLVVIAALSLATFTAFLLGRRVLGWWGGVGAASFVVMWSPYFACGKLWYESLLAPLYALVLILLYPGRAPSRARAAVAGLLLGMAILTKQHAVVVAAGLVAWEGWRRWREDRTLRPGVEAMALLTAGAALPMVVYLAWHWVQNGSLAEVTYWLVTHSLVGQYWELAAKPPDARAIAIVAGGAVVVPFVMWRGLGPGPGTGPARSCAALGLLMLASGSATAVPRFELFHLQPILPVLGWLSVVAVAESRVERSRRVHPRWIAVVVVVYAACVAGRAYAPAFRPQAEQEIQEFSDLVPVARAAVPYMRPSDAIYVFPDEERTANLYYLLRRTPPGFWAFTYPWNMTGHVNERILRLLEERRPEWILAPPDSRGTAPRAPAIVAFIANAYQPVASLPGPYGPITLLRRER